MYNIIAKTKGMDKKDWLMLRKNGIGSSDAGGVCGLNPYMSPLEVYAAKTCEGVEVYSKGCIKDSVTLVGEYLEKNVKGTFLYSII